MLNSIVRQVVSGAPVRGRQASAPERGVAQEGRPPRTAGRDTLSLSGDRNGDGALSLDEVPYDRVALRRFARLDRDGDGRLTQDELGSASRRRQSCQAPVAAAPRVPAAPAAPEAPAAPPVFGYTTLNAHPAWELAAQLGAEPDALLAANGWTDPEQMVPGGTVVQVPDTPITRANATAFGGAITEAGARPAGAPEEARPAPAAMATAAEEPRPAAGPVAYISQYHPDGQDQAYNEATASGAAQCGATATAMALKAFGYGEGLTDAQLIMAAGGIIGTDVVNGTGWYTLQQGLDAMDGFRSERHGPGADVGWIQERLAQGQLVLANGDYYAMPPHIDEGMDGGHWVTVLGYDAASDTFQVHDPAYDNGGAPLSVTGDQLAYFINSNTTTGEGAGSQVAFGPEA